MRTPHPNRTITGLMLGLTLLMAALPAARPVEAGWQSLTGLLPVHTIIQERLISPDSRYVIYVADVDVDEQYELYSVPITGTTPIKLNATLIAGGSILYFAVTPDSQYVVYTADQEVMGRSDLYRVPITGGPSVRLNGALVAGGNVLNHKIDPDNMRVVYLADQEMNDVYEIYSVPIAGGSAVKLNSGLTAGGDVLNFDIDPFGSQVVYIADQIVNDRYEIYGVPIASGTAVRLNPPNSRDTFNFELFLSSEYVVFSAKPNGSNSMHLYMNRTSSGLLTHLLCSHRWGDTGSAGSAICADHRPG
jgi:Tol biopolymer transport system component